MQREDHQVLLALSGQEEDRRHVSDGEEGESVRGAGGVGRQERGGEGGARGKGGRRGAQGLGHFYSPGEGRKGGANGVTRTWGSRSSPPPWLETPGAGVQPQEMSPVFKLSVPNVMS